MTDYHDLNTPAEGRTDWHIPLNENFERIDRKIEIRDTEDALSEYEPQERAKFLATDTGTIYIGSGSEWTELSLTETQSGITYTSGDVTVQKELLDTYTAPSSEENQRQVVDYSYSDLSEYDEYEMVVRTYNEDVERGGVLNFCGYGLPRLQNLRAKSIVKTVGYTPRDGDSPNEAVLRSELISNTVREVLGEFDSVRERDIDPIGTRNLEIADALTFSVDKYSAFAPDLTVRIEVYGTAIEY